MAKHAPRGPLKARDAMDGAHPMDAPRCTATSKQSGERCKRRPIVGGFVCVMHGGKAPQVKAAAQERLLALQDTALMRLGWLMGQESYPTVVYAASRDVLDRTLGKPAESVAVQHSGGVSIGWRDTE